MPEKKQIKIIKDEVKFLSNINKVLQRVEAQIIDKVTVSLQEAETKLLKNSGGTTDYEVEATVGYFLGDEDHPTHTYWDVFRYEDVIINKDYGMLIDNGNGTDWHRQGKNMPKLDTPYCYLLHDLIDYGKVGINLFLIDTIWVDVVYTDQIEVLIDGGGSMIF